MGVRYDGGWCIWNLGRKNRHSREEQISDNCICENVMQCAEIEFDVLRDRVSFSGELWMT